MMREADSSMKPTSPPPTTTPPSLLSRWGIALPLMALALLAVWPLFQYGPPGDIDAPNHFYRFIALDWHIQHGDWYPRWFTDINFGLGGPVLNFYAPLSYYILVVLRVFVSSAVLAFTLGFALAILVAILGMYRWVSEQFGSQIVGLVASAAYVLSPYLFINLLRRGALPELWGLALAPWLFWAVHQVALRPNRWNRLTLTGLYAALLLTHNLSAVLFTLPLLLYGLIQSGPLREVWQTRFKALRPIGLSLLLGVFLTTFFWLPFFTEISYVQIQRAQIDWTSHFIGWNELLSLPHVYDADYITHDVPLSLPWPQIILMGLALVWSWRQRRLGRETWRIVLVAALQVLAFMLLMTAITQPLWSISALAPLIQFPWRLLGPATLWLGWLSGLSLLAVSNNRWRNILGLSLITIFFLYSYNWTYGYPTRPYPQTATSLDFNRFEIDNPTWAGTTVSQEFLPVWVQSFTPGQTPPINFASEPTPSRLAPLPSGVTLISEQHTINSWSFQYTASQSFTATFYQFYFPGWSATLDNQTVRANASQPEGLVQVPAPAGTHTLSLARTLTQPELIGILISLVAVGLLFIPLRATVPLNNLASVPQSALPLLSSGVWTAVLILLLVAKVTVLDHLQAPFRVAGEQSVPNPISAQFGNDMALIGFAFPNGQQVPSGSHLGVTLYWKALQQMNTRYSTSLQLVDAYGNRFGQSDNYSPGDIPTPFWPSSHYSRDSHTLTIPEGTPPGDYHLHSSVYSGDAGSFTPLALSEGGGLDFDLGTTIIITSAQPGPSAPLSILNASLANTRAMVGDTVAFTTEWYSGNAPLPPLQARFALTDRTGKLVFFQDLPPARPDYPTNLWPLNQKIVYPQSIVLPPDLPVGPLQATLILVKADGSFATKPYLLGSLTITVPERSFTVPAITHPTNTVFNNAIRLLGYDLGPDTITLYWQSVQPVSVPLTVFIHRFGAGGTFEAGQDSAPARSTTSWLPGEVITDVHSLVVTDNFEIGLYNSATGERFGEPYKIQP
jgi:6-pyruvoyl-tetrahydropterin synthase related domain